MGEFELDESCFGARRVRGKKGRGAAGKTPVFGLLKSDGKVFMTIVPNYSKKELMPIIQGGNPDRVDDSHQWLKSLRWPHFEWL